MFVARSFSYTSERKKRERQDEKTVIRGYTPGSSSEHRGFGWRPESFKKHQQSQMQMQRELRRVSSEPRLSSEGRSASCASSATESPQPTLPIPSKPVAVPSRPSSRHQSTPQSSPDKLAKSLSKQSKSRQVHGPNAVPPSVSALLATTSIPKPKTFRRTKPKASPRRVSIDEVVDEWRQSDFQMGTPGVSPAMDILLSPPDEEADQLAQIEHERTSPPSRSTSTESMPSLAPDSSSGISWSVPSTPENYLRAGGRSTPRSVDISFEHPLMSLPETEETQFEEDEAGTRLRSMSPSPTVSPSCASSTSRSTSRSRGSTKRDPPSWSKPFQTTSFKSNLTASLSNFRNNISRTFSNFSASSSFPTLSDDHLTRSLLGTSYHPEMRPRPMSGTPTPQMRRYMNPHAIHLYEFHLHNSHIDDADLEYAAAANEAAAEARAHGDPNAPAAPEVDVIPLDTYVRNPSSRRCGAVTEAGRAIELAEGKPQQQRREPRENPEFLRIAVLEMQMRRAGKTEGPLGGVLLGAGGVGGNQAGNGRRGWFLPPRADVTASNEEDVRMSQKRWVSVAAQ